MMQKIRAFWLKEKIMTNIYAIYFLEGGIEVEDGCCYSEFIKDGNVVLMQSTGLHDKNGINIFEGDIVKPRIGNPFVVKHFIFGQGVFKTALITSDGHGFDGIYHGSLVEVIGNVEQNPELLDDV